MTGLEQSYHQVAAWQRLLSHFDTASLQLGDRWDNQEELQIRARAQSGDYFMTLATELDKLAQALTHAGHSRGKQPSSADAEASDVERLVSELLYVHEHYNIESKTGRESKL